MVKIKSILSFLAYLTALLGYLPLISHLDLFPRLLLPVSIGAGIWIDRRERRLLPGLIITGVTVILFGYYALRFSRTDIITPAVNLLTVLLAIRLADEKKHRHYLQIYALSLFTLAGSTLFNLEPVFLVYLVVMLLSISVSLVLLTFLETDQQTRIPFTDLRKILTISGSMPLISLPLIVIFFIILPRTQFPLWNFMQGSGKKVTGFSETVSLGKSSSVEEVRSVAFRVETQRLGRNQLYWRGIVLNSFQGSSWVRKEPPTTENFLLRVGTPVRQVIYPEPGLPGYFFALNFPRTLTGIRSYPSADDIYVRRSSSDKRAKYEAESLLLEALPVRQGIDREFYLTVPEQVSGRIEKLAATLKGTTGDSSALLSQIQAFFLNGNFRYATKGLPLSQNPLDDFLFAGKAGNCEYFASSFALICRLMGLPSRLVGGYLGGEYNELGGYYIVSEDMAHVWVEVFIKGKGWVTVDPSRYATNSGVIGGQRAKGFALRLRLMTDMLNYQWNRLVITYDLERQFKMLQQSNQALKGFNIAQWLKLLLMATGFLLALSALVFSRKVFKRENREARILKKYLTVVGKRYGELVELDGAGLFAMAEATGNPDMMRFAQIYGGALYRDRKLDESEFRELLEIIAKLK